MKIYISTLFLFLFLWMCGNAQSLTKGEYYIDTDPGAGSGTAFTFTKADSINLPVSIPMNALAVGFHKMYFRIQDSTNKWGLSNEHLFYVYDNTTPSPPVAAQLKKGEYYIDTDPGAGNGTAFTFTQADSINLPVSIPMNALAVGFHKLYSRIQDASNKWGLSNEHLFYVYDNTIPSPPVAAQLKKGEYYIDTDPGAGNGTAFTFTQADSINLPVSIPMNALAVGFHKLYSRIQDASNKWGLSNEHLFYVYDHTSPSPPVAAPVASMEYFFDANDYGPGQCAPYTAFASADSVNANGGVIAIDPMFLTALSLGHHTLNIRARDAFGKWGLTKSVGITVCNQKATSAFTFSVSATMVTFTNNSVKDYGTQWSFGDATFSTDTNNTITHTYNNGGTIDVCLISYSGCGNDTVCHNVTLNCTPPTPAYTFTTSNLTATFTNNNPTATSYYWNFGDSKTSTDPNPVHIYQNTGTYSVCYSAYNGCGSTPLCKTVSVTCVVPTASFVATVNGLTASLTNLSTNAANFIWRFGDTQTDNTNYNAIHQYSVAGTYLVKLTVQNGCGNNTYQTNITINCTAPVVAFDTITNGLQLEVNNNSSNGTSWLWSFGDATTSPFKNPPIHTYSAMGTYNVCLKANNNCGTDSVCKTVFVCTPPAGSFTNNVSGLTVNFTNATTNASYYVWNFGDGNISNIVNPSHTYSTTQTYSVCLTAYNGCGNNQVCHNIKPNCTPNTAAQICLVTVDSVSKYNVIVWDKTPFAGGGIDSFFVYRDTANNNYALIGKVPFASLSQFSDTLRTKYAANGDPNATTWKYKIAAKDTCGNISPRSPYHKTLFIQNNSGNFSWNDYLIEGQAVPVPALQNYLFQRDNLSNGNWITIATLSASSLSYTDGAYATYQNTATWRVLTQWSISCTPTIINPKNPQALATTVNGSKSNNYRTITAFTTSVSIINASCSAVCNATATATITGGVAPYTYSWSSGCSTSACSNLCGGNTYTLIVTDAGAHTQTTTVSITTNPAMTSSFTITNVSCRGGGNGTATVNITNGTSPYSYLWNNNSQTNQMATGLSATTYSITITDANSCTKTASVTITQPSLALTTTTTPTNVLCYGGNGSATVTANGGTGIYSYVWSSGSSTSAANNLAAGPYTVTVTDANSCTKTASVTITQPSAALTATTTPTHVLCYGGNGNATVIAGGGTGIYSYVWSSGSSTSAANNLAAGPYTVTVTDANSCTKTASVTITQPSAALTATTTPTHVLCYGGNGSATVTASGGTGAYSYVWSSGSSTSAANNLTAGPYTVTVTDANSCTKTASVTITQPSTALTSTVTNTSASCNTADGTASISAAGGTGSYTYLWSNTTQTTASITGLLANSYSVTVTDANGCTSTGVANVLNVGAPTASVTPTNVTDCFGGSNGNQIGDDGFLTSSPFLFLSSASANFLCLAMRL